LSYPRPAAARLGELLTMMTMNVEKNRASVKIVLADSDSYMRQGLRNAFATEGYQDFRTVGRVTLLRELLASTPTDLLILDVDAPDGDAIGLVRDIRAGKLGRNPFLPIIMATWDADPGKIGRAAHAGVDAILAKPLAPAHLFSRIDFLVNSRKPFIATNTYFGPERRTRERQGCIRHFEVPNTLKDKIEGRPVDPAALDNQVGALMQEMEKSRLETSAALLVEKVAEVCDAYETGTRRKGLGNALVMINRMAEDIRHYGKGEITKLSASLVGVASPLLRGDRELGGREVELLRPLSRSILLAAQPYTDDPGVAAEIARAVARFSPQKLQGGDVSDERRIRMADAQAQVALELMA
jgi:DNA-binding response OmpR family regulator